MYSRFRASCPVCTWHMRLCVPMLSIVLWVIARCVQTGLEPLKWLYCGWDIESVHNMQLRMCWSSIDSYMHTWIHFDNSYISCMCSGYACSDSPTISCICLVLSCYFHTAAAMGDFKSLMNQMLQQQAHEMEAVCSQFQDEKNGTIT